MIISYCILLCLCRFVVNGLDNLRTSKSTYENCTIEEYQRKFDVLPGTGWDNLANLKMGRVLNLNFSKCFYSDDNRFLIPNQLSLTPEKISHVELFSETIEHFMNYTSATSKSINVDAEGGYDGFKFGGSFSYENSQIKNDQLRTKSLLTRVQLRYNVYQSLFEPDTPLFPTFKDRIMDIAGMVVQNKDSLYPAYLADMIVRDYGTHVIRSVSAGAVLSKTDAISSSYAKQYTSDETTITASASASFLSFFSIKTSFQTKSSTEQMNEYNKNCVKTHVDTIGGTIFGSNFSLKNWEDSVMGNLVPIDRRGDPIYYVLTPRALPELDDDTVNKVYLLLKDAVQRYYTRNARTGCLDILSPNFNSDANIDAGNCKTPEVNFTMGGVYQTCTGSSDQCDGHSQINPLTGTYSCPTGFTSIMLLSGQNQCKEYCSGAWFWKKCHTTCSNFATYWCYPQTDGPNHNGYQFGGFISKTMPACSLDYISLKLGNNVQICVSSNADPMNPYAIKFGGFFSCNVGNPLDQYNIKNKKNFIHNSEMKDLAVWPKSCPDGYVAHIATIDRGCQISYCTETNKFSLGPSPDLIRPPFIELNYNPNSTKVMLFSNNRGETFVKDKSGSWKMQDLEQHNRNVLIGSVIGAILCMALICLVLFLIQRKHYRRKIHALSPQTYDGELNSNGYGTINHMVSV